MAIIIYFFSDANEISKIIGRKIDDALLRKKTSSDTSLNNQVNYSKLALSILLTLIPIATTIYSSYNHYKQVISIIEGDSDGRDILTEAFKDLCLVMIFFSSYSKLIFQLSFMPSIYNKLDNCLYKETSRHYSAGFFSQDGRSTVEESESSTPLLLELPAASDEEEEGAVISALLRK